MKTALVSTIAVLTVVKYAWTDYTNQTWHWTWTCDLNEEKCVKTKEVGDPLNASSNYGSLPVCRLTCGRYGALWPRPTVTTVLAHQLIPVHPDHFEFQILKHKEELTEFFDENEYIFRQKITSECEGSCSVIPDTKITVYITVEKDVLDLRLGTNESYSLEITTKGEVVSVKIYSANVYGARHALETLSQLVAAYKINSGDENKRIVGLVMVSSVRIHDKPIYTHRGLLLDVARNFLPIKTIKRQIDAMSGTKLNTLHLHLTDSQSFPLESKRIPQLSKYGAYSNQKVYRPHQIEALVKYAKFRGIKIIMEIDSPSHVGNGWQWGKQEGLGDLAVCVNKQPWRQYCIQPPCGQLNPSNKNIYNVLGDLYNDILDMMPETDMFHMGGDEVFIPCWNSSQDIIQYLRNRGRTQSTEDFLDLWGEFQNLALNAFDLRTQNQETPIILWSSMLTEPSIIQKYLSTNRFVIQTWVPASDPLPQNLINLGYRLIISTKDAWYLDHGFWGRTEYHNWRTVYANTLPRDKNVLGGEVCMWGEYVDENSIDGKVWPRAAAAAERLWSDPATSTAKSESRFYRHRQRLVTRGIQADALAPRWCYQNEGECT